MLNEQELIADLQLKLDRASESRKRIRKRLEAGHSHESHLAYSDGLVDGIESAIVTIVAMHHKLDKASAMRSESNEGETE